MLIGVSTPVREVVKPIVATTEVLNAYSHISNTIMPTDSQLKYFSDWQNVNIAHHYRTP